MVTEHRGTDWRGLWPGRSAARIPGTVLGVWLVASCTDQVIGVAVGVMVLLACCSPCVPCTSR